MKVLLIATAVLILLTPPSAAAQTKPANLAHWYALKIVYPGLENSTGLGTHCDPIFGPYKQSVRMGVSPMMRNRRDADPAAQVTTVLIGAVPQQDQWEVRVSVVFDDLYNQGKRRIATRRVQLGDSISIDELTEVGLVPFTLSVVELKQRQAIPPELVNNLMAVEVAGIEVSVAPQPHVLTVRNLSDKDIHELQIDLFRGDVRGALMTPTGTWDKPLIKAHGSRKILILSNLPAPDAPDPCRAEEPLSIRFASVVFADRSYEGEPFWAASQRAVAVGNGLQIARVLPLIGKAQTTPNSDPANIVRQLKESALALDESVPAGALQGLNSAFPSLNDPETNLIGHARFGMNLVKCDLLADLKIFDRLEAAKLPGTLPDWLEKEKAKYERWRATLR